MNTNHSKRQEQHQVPPSSTIVYVCRDCCCGTQRKHPDVDHDAQLDALQHAIHNLPGGRVVVTRCLGECRWSNVIGIRQFVRGRSPQTLWLGGILPQHLTDLLCHWLTEGGPAQYPLPSALARRQFRPEKGIAVCPRDF